MDIGIGTDWMVEPRYDKVEDTVMKQTKLFGQKDERLDIFQVLLSNYFSECKVETWSDQVCVGGNQGG